MLDFSFADSWSIPLFILILSVLVFVHELGHFLAARFFKIHVEEFALGFPPRAVGVVRDRDQRWRVFFGQNVPGPEVLGGPRTIYSLNWLPIGGFVRPAGEDNPGVYGGLAAAPKLARLTVLAAGSAFNLIFAFAIFIVGFRAGWPDRVTIAAVAPGSPAETAGLQLGDVLLTANADEIHHVQQVSRAVYANLGRPLTLEVARGEQTLTLAVTPRTEWPAGEGPMGIGMGLAVVHTYSWGESVVRAGEEIVFQFTELARLPGDLASGALPLAQARPVGIVGMHDVTREAVLASQSINAWYPILQVIGLISVALATTNLLPLPALDGGRILFVLIEAVRGRRIDPAREGLVHMIGMLILLALMVVITYQDIVNPILPR